MMCTRKNIVLLILLSIVIESFTFHNQSIEDKHNLNHVSLNLLDINSELDQVLDSVLSYDLEKTEILDQIYFYVYVYEDSLKENIVITIHTDLKKELNFIPKGDFEGIIEKDNLYFLLLKENSELVSCHTDKYLDLTYSKIDNNYYPTDFDGPAWIYVFNRHSKAIRLWRFDSAIDLSK